MTTTDDKQRTAQKLLSYLAVDITAGDDARVLALIAAGTDLTATMTLWQQTALHLVAWKKEDFTPIFTALLDAGAPMNERDLNNMTPLMIAVETGAQPALVEALIKKGAKPGLKDNKGRTAPDLARLLKETHEDGNGAACREILSLMENAHKIRAAELFRQKSVIEDMRRAAAKEKQDYIDRSTRLQQPLSLPRRKPPGRTS